MTAVLLALASSLAAAASAAPAPPPLEVVAADQIEYDVALERGVARGDVVLRRGAVTLRADVASYDTRTGVVDATGRVLLTQPGRAIAATAMHAVLDGPLEAHDVVAFLKDAPLDLSRCRTLEEARATGRNRTTFAGSEVTSQTQGADRFEVDRARVTLCDCGAAAPSWEIRARHATVIPGKSALFTWPVFYITPRFLFLHTPVPVLVLPVAYLPLSDRQTGLLFPVLTFGGVTGFGISQPLFLTLGRSWDATVTADYLFGPTSSAAKGPGTSLELRWAPAEGARGQVKLSLLHSLSQLWPQGVALPPGWNRLALSGFHDQRISDRTFFRLEFGLIGDPLYYQDFTGDALLRATEYRRSAAALTHRSDDFLLEVDAAYLLAQAHLDSGTAVRAPFGAFGGDLSTFHRLPAASASLLPRRLVGPIRLSATAGLARFAPLRGVTGDQGQDGIGPGERGWSGSAIDPGERDGRWTPPGPGGPGERLAATRALTRVELRAPFTVGRAIELEPWVNATAAAYAFEAALDPQVDARAVAGLGVSTRIARTFGAGAGRVRHTIEPRVEWRGGTGQWGPGLPNYAYDEFDVALPPLVVTSSGVVAAQRTLSAIPGSFSQLQLSVANRLSAPSGPLSNTFLELTVGQDLDVAAAKPSETWARAALRFPRVTTGAFARFRAFGAAAPPGTPPAIPASALDSFTELGANVMVADGRGDNVHASFIALGAGGSPRVMAGLEPFFDPRPAAESAVALGQVGVAGRLGGATLSYDAFFYGRPMAPVGTAGAFTPACGNKSLEPHVYQQAASLVWDSPCHCWKAGLTAVLNECDDRPRFGVVVDFSSLGGGRVGTP